MIVIVATSMMSYKIETFTNLTDPNAYPQTPNNETCYNYIKNVKKWNVDELTNEQKKVLFTMRATQGTQYSAETKVFPFKDGCAIPRNHLPIFNTDENASSLTVNPKNKSPITIEKTDKTMYPQGVYTDFTDPSMTFNKFKNFLTGAYDLYDSDFLIEKEKLEIEIKRLTSTRDYWKQVLADLVNRTNHYYRLTDSLLAENSECQEIKRYNLTVLLPEWNKLLGVNNDVVNRINQLWGNLWNGWTQIWQLQRCRS